MRGLWAVFAAASILIAGCTSTTTVTRASPSTAACFDAAKVKGLYDEWAHTDTNLSEDNDVPQVLAALRMTREIALELARATAADPAASGHFKDAADAYAKVPLVPPDARVGSMSRSDLDRLVIATADNATAMTAGVDALNNSIIPFC